MTDRTAVPERVSQHAKTARRGASSGSQPVGDYVGQPAGEAAQAVRRAGLRPGLDRSFGCPAELIGLVVAQDPVAGSDLARNGMVTLYVAAPGGEPLSSDGDAASSDGGQFDDDQTGEAPIEEKSSTSPAMTVRARRRKPGHARRSIEPAPTPPPPTAIEPAPPEGLAALPVAEPLESWPAEVDAPVDALEHELADEQSEREFGHDDEFVVHIEDVLAGRNRLPNWRRAHPRRPLGSARRFCGWFGEHRLLAGVAGLALSLWLVVGVTSTLDGHHPSLRGGAVSPKHAPGARRFGAMAKSASAEKPRVRQTAARRALLITKRYERRAGSRRVVSTASRHLRAALSAASEAVASTATQAPAPQPSQAPTSEASAPSTPTREQNGGGVFSP